MQEKRRHPRVEINVEVSCEPADGPSFSGTLADISVGGIFIQTEERPPFGTELTTVGKLPGAGLVRLTGIVRWAKEGGFGVQFGLLGAAETHAITNVIRRNR